MKLCEDICKKCEIYKKKISNGGYGDGYDSKYEWNEEHGVMGKGMSEYAIDWYCCTQWWCAYNGCQELHCPMEFEHRMVEWVM